MGSGRSIDSPDEKPIGGADTHCTRERAPEARVSVFDAIFLRPTVVRKARSAFRDHERASLSRTTTAGSEDPEKKVRLQLDLFDDPVVFGRVQRDDPDELL
jgi:hypothetical protein